MKTEYYFAIASMMNPVSLKLRNLNPIESRPAILLDFELIYYSTRGFAAAIYSPGKSFHGVLHKVTLEDMAVLDQMEAVYERLQGTTRLYDGSELKCTVYANPDPKFHGLQKLEYHPPTERYVDIMCEGALHFGVSKEYVEQLRSMDCQPRLKPDQYKKLEVDDNLPVWDTKKLLEENGKDAEPLYTTINKKVIRLVGDISKIMPNILKMAFMDKKLISEIVLAKMFYDPKYGFPSDDIRDYCEEQRNY